MKQTLLLPKPSYLTFETVDPEEYDEVFGVIYAEPRFLHRQIQLSCHLGGKLTQLWLLQNRSQLLMELKKLRIVVVDIGAGTTDIARIHGTFPSDDDQITIQEAGDWLDLAMELVEKKYTAHKLPRTWSAVGKKPHPMLVRKSRR